MVTDNVGANGGVDPGKMTIAELKSWLDQHDQQEKLWELGQKKAKKPEYVQCVHDCM